MSHRFAADSLLEGDGFELPVPDERGYGLAFVCGVMGLPFGAQPLGFEGSDAARRRHPHNRQNAHNPRRAECLQGESRTLFGAYEPQKRAEHPVELYESILSVYQTSPRERLLEFMAGHPNIETFCQLSQLELAKIYAEGIANNIRAVTRTT
jgi:hypothetical protein